MPYLDHFLKIRSRRIQEKRPQRKVIKGAKRDAVASKVMDVLKDWRSSPFQNEGACVAGLRSALCLDGMRYPIADFEAHSIVEECFVAMGAERPSWQQGQPEYLEHRETCRWCKCDLPDDLTRGSVAWQYCSEVCVAAARLKQRLHYEAVRDQANQLASYAIGTLRAEVKPCQACGASFRNRNPDAKYCSAACFNVGHTKRHKRDCAQCGVTFRPNGTAAEIEAGRRGFYCSPACYQASRVGTTREPRFECECVFCSITFAAPFKSTRYCSQACRMSAFALKRGQLPKKLKPRVFDYLFITVPQRKRPPRLTAQVFDAWFKRAA
jgi:hypothetical protein